MRKFQSSTLIQIDFSACKLQQNQRRGRNETQIAAAKQIVQTFTLRLFLIQLCAHQRDDNTPSS